MIRTAESPAGRSKPTTARRRRATPLGLALLAAAVLAAACSGGSLHDPAASSPNGTTTSSARQSGVLFDSCIRAHGIPDFPDSDVSLVGGQLDIHIPRYLKSEPQFQTALHACQKDLPEGGASPKHVNIREELNFARCMRSHGITDFPDPMAGGGFDVPGDTNSPQFEAAARVCQATGIHWNGS